MHRRNINRFDAHKTDLFGEEITERREKKKIEKKEEKKNQRTHYSKRKNLRI